jgi:N-acetylmuramic acid 6-phosphate (MurNAc-6-P) etherase
MEKKKQRITELAHDATAELDVAPAVSAVRMLREADAQMYTGFRGHAGIYDAEHLASLERLADAYRRVMAEGGIVCAGGCGTSGRIAFLAARDHARHWRRSAAGGASEQRAVRFEYLSSGGDVSLLLSNELPEDDAALGESDVRRVLGLGEVPAVPPGGHRLSIGITCGLSAAYVAGMVGGSLAARGGCGGGGGDDAADADADANSSNVETGLRSISVALVGFNPVGLARDVPLPGWRDGTSTCQSVFGSLAGDGAIVMNPVVGPEPVAGSSRMKGGSMTKVLLDVAFARAMDARRDDGDTAATGADAGRDSAAVPLRVYLEAMEVAARRGFGDVEGLARAADLFADAMRTAAAPHGHVYLLGRGTAGVMGLIDASEMVDTYGCSDDAVRAFVADGWGSFGNVEGDLSRDGVAVPLPGQERLLRISLADFERDVAPTVTARDVIIVATIEQEDMCEAGASTEAACFPPRALLEQLARERGVRIVTVRVLEDEDSNHDAVGGGGDAEKSCISSAAAVDVVIRIPASRAPSPGASGSPVTFLERPGVLFRHQLALKVALNTISTLGQVRAGKVMGNRMISLTISNDKLMHRAADIVAGFTGRTFAESWDALLRAIYNTDDLEATAAAASATDVATHPSSIREASTEDHIRRATPNPRALPTAILVASGMKVADAVAALDAEPVVRKVIEANSRMQQH